jgi:hypothetical protein
MSNQTVSAIYSSKWLSADDLRGQSAVVTIEGAIVESIRQQDGQQEPRIVLSFVGKQKRLICNKSQATALTTITGTEAFANWRGHTVMLMPGMSPNKRPTVAIFPAPPPSFGGQRVVESAPPPALEDLTDDDIPF